jgi:hypothetical protein
MGGEVREGTGCTLNNKPKINFKFLPPYIVLYTITMRTTDIGNKTNYLRSLFYADIQHTSGFSHSKKLVISSIFYNKL